MPGFEGIIASTDQSTLDQAIEVSSKVDIVEVRLVDLASRLSEWGGEAPALIKTAHGAVTERCADQEMIKVEAQFEFALAHDTEESKKNPPVSIRATFALIYKVHGTEDFSDQAINAFGLVNGVYNAWPFWRELVYSTMAKMGLPPVTLPVYRVMPTDPRDD